jgi:LysR family nitrogen assimilation transcriptional regulator
MREMDEIRDEVITERTQLSGQVAVGMPPTVAELMTVPLARAFRAAHPRVTLCFVTAFTGHLLEWLQRGDLDVAVLYDPQPLRSLRTQPMLLENLFVVGPADREFSLVRAVPFASIAQQPLLLPGARHSLRVLVEKAARESAVQLEVPIEADSLATLKDLVLEGMGITILPLATIHREVTAGRLKAAPLVEPALSRRLVLASSRDRAMRRSALELGKTLVEVVTGLVEGGHWAGQLIGQ